MTNTNTFLASSITCVGVTATLSWNISTYECLSHRDSELVRLAILYSSSTTLKRHA